MFVGASHHFPQFLRTPSLGPSSGRGRAPPAPVAAPRPRPCSLLPGAGVWRRVATKVVFDPFIEFLNTFTIIAAKKIAGYKKSKTADLSQKIEAGSQHHLKDEGSGSQELDIDTLFDDQTKTPRRKSSFIEHISSLLKSIL